MATNRPEAKPLIVGPLPPPIGGIASIIAKLLEAPGAREDLCFLDTSSRRGGAKLTRTLQLLWELHRRLGRRPRHVLIFSSAYASFWEKGAWLVMARMRRVPMAVMMVDGNFPAFHAGLAQPLQSLVRWLLERFSTVIVQTESWRRYYQRVAPAADLRVLSNGVDSEEFRPIKRTLKEVPMILFVGWLIPAKGVFDLVDAAQTLKGRGLRFVMRLLGPQHGHEAELAVRIRDAGVTDLVDVPGATRSRAELLAAYAEADIFALPSWAEGLPNALLEAMACGLPVVATEVGGMPDVVEDGVSGLLVPAKNAAALADALQRVLRDSELRAMLGRNSRARIEAAFSNHQFISGVRTLLEARS